MEPRYNEIGTFFIQHKSTIIDCINNGYATEFPFFPHNFDPNIEELEKVLSSPLIMTAFQEKFDSWQLLDKYEIIDSIKINFVDYFFYPFEKTNSWKNFLIDNTSTDNVNTDALIFTEDRLSTKKINNIRDHIAWAFCLKITDLWQKKNFPRIKNHKKLFTLLDTLINITEFDPTLAFLSHYSDQLIQALIRKKNNYLDNMFEEDTSKNKILFDDMSSSLTKEPDDILTNPQIIYSFQRKFDHWKITLDQKEMIQTIQKDFVDYFFYPLESCSQWKNFLASLTPTIASPISGQDEIIILKEEKKSSDSTEDKLLFRNSIAVSFCYQIINFWEPINPDELIKNKEKLLIFKKILHLIGHPNKMAHLQEKRKNSFMSTQINQLEKTIETYFKLKNKKNIGQAVQAKINIIQNSKKYKILEMENEIELYRLLIKMFRHLITYLETNVKYKKDTYPIKKVAEAILLQINNKYGHLAKGAMLPDYIMNVISELREYIGTKTNKKCNHLLSCYETNKKISSNTPIISTHGQLKKSLRVSLTHSTPASSSYPISNKNPNVIKSRQHSIEVSSSPIKKSNSNIGLKQSKVNLFSTLPNNKGLLVIETDIDINKKSDLSKSMPSETKVSNVFNTKEEKKSYIKIKRN